MSGGGVEVRIGVKVRGERSNIIGGLEVCTPCSRPDKRQTKGSSHIPCYEDAVAIWRTYQFVSCPYSTAGLYSDEEMNSSSFSDRWSHD